MCYQVVERYNLCRCLYYKHAIDPCAAWGQRGHSVQEKTVLVGYACSQHTEHSGSDLFGSTQDIVKAFDDSDNSSDDEGSIFSSVVAVSRATSFIAADGADTVDDILNVLLNDPLLRWENLVCQASDDAKTKDVRFFLRAYELSLRAEADSNIERHICTFVRSRLQYFTANICEHFHLKENRERDIDDKGTSRDGADLDLVAYDELDPALIPSFSLARSFLFEGVAYEALKGNLRDFTTNERDYVEEVLKIIVQCIHPPKKDSTELAQIKPWSLGNFSKVLHALVTAFARQLAIEAIEFKTSASDRIGTRKLADTDGIAQLHARLHEIWDSAVPPWHFYPLVPGDGNELDYSRSDSNRMSGSRTDSETFKAFVCSSRALLDLANACTEPSQRSSATFSVSAPSTSPHNEASIDRSKISFTCSCGSKITDSYVGSAGLPDVNQKLRQLRMLSMQQMYQQAAYSATRQSSAIGSIRDAVASLSWSRTTNGTRLPFHQQDSTDSSNTGLGTLCSSQSSTNQHDHSFIHWCIPSTRYATHMSALQACSMRSDITFFHNLRAHYKQMTGRYKSALSFRKPIALRFIKFRLYDRQLVDIHDIDAIPPESEKHEYDYYPMPAETVPPIGPKLLMHFFLQPDHASMQPILLRNIPKRRRNKLEPCPIAGSSMGWGIDVVTGVDHLKVFGLGLVGTLASMVFGIAWAIVKKDIQGGFAVAGFMLTLAITTIGSLRALDL